MLRTSVFGGLCPPPVLKQWTLRWCL